MTQINGFYINLDRSPERREHMDTQLGALGIDWVKRFRAVDGQQLEVPPGCALSAAGLACYLSHLQIMETTPADSYTFIFEDDVELSADLVTFMDDDFWATAAGYDIVLLDCQPSSGLEEANMFWDSLKKNVVDPKDLQNPAAARRLKGIDFHPAPHMYRWGLSSYIVTPKGHRNIPPVARECLDRGPPGQLDILMVHALEDGRLSGCMTVPFLATPLLASVTNSTVGGIVQPTDVARDLTAVRRLFFAGPIGPVHEFVQRTPPRADEAEPFYKLLTDLASGLENTQDNAFVAG